MVKKITQKERKVQEALGTLKVYDVIMTIPIAAYNLYRIKIKAANEKEAIARAKTLNKNSQDKDDLGYRYIDTCTSECDGDEIGLPTFIAYEEEDE